MSAQSKSARDALKAKARRLASENPGKVDASSYTIPTDMHAEAKTGMRPISKRAFKRGGKVEGEVSGVRADRKPRASGGQAKANAFINRNAKDANEEREGIKHTGGLKAGGRAKRAAGGSDMVDPRETALAKVAAASNRVPQGNGIGTFVGTKAGLMARQAGLKRGGSLEGTAKDKAEDKVMAAKRGMSMKQWEASAADKRHDRPKRASGGPMDQSDTFPPERGDDRPPLPRRPDYDTNSGKPRPVIDLSERLGKYAKGGAAHDKNCVCKACGGRMARASGGRTKSGKTNVNIIIATGGKPHGAPGDMLPPSMGAPPQGMPVAVPPPPGAGGPPQAMPVPMPMPMPMPPQGGGAPMPRATGGRTYRSYKDMDAGALGGKGRLEKAEIQAHKR